MAESKVLFLWSSHLENVPILVRRWTKKGTRKNTGTENNQRKLRQRQSDLIFTLQEARDP